MVSERKRLIVGKMGLDSHDNGIRIVCKWLMDNGYEVIYAGLYNTTKSIVQMALEENADAIGVSFLGGEHLFYVGELVEALKNHGMSHIRVIVGGVIPPEDVEKLKKLGAAATFTPGTPRKCILKGIEMLLD